MRENLFSLVQNRLKFHRGATLNVCLGSNCCMHLMCTARGGWSTVSVAAGPSCERKTLKQAHPHQSPRDCFRMASYCIQAALLYSWFWIEPWQIVPHKIPEDLEVRHSRGLVQLIRLLGFHRASMVIADLEKDRGKSG